MNNISKYTADLIPAENEQEYVSTRNEVELQLTQIWEEVLGIQPIEVRDNFFELGGDSLLAVRLFAQIEQKFRRMPISTLFKAPTVEQLASVLCQKEEPVWSLLVPIQADGDKLPLFCVHGSDGNILIFKNLVNYLGPTQPIYGLQPKGLDGKQAPQSRIEDIADSYIRQIRTIQPQGPYLLAGNSAGGVVAFEMAQQLKKQGQKVAMLALFDTHGAIYYRPSSYRAWASQHFSRFLQLEPKKKLPYLLRGIKDRLEKITDKFHKIIGHSLPQVHKSSTPVVIADNRTENDKVISIAQRQALVNYIPQVYSGRVILFRSDEQPWWITDDLELGWAGLAAEGLEIHAIPGDHSDIVRANVKVLAEKLRAYLDAAQG